jgi:hypothetical protein
MHRAAERFWRCYRDLPDEVREIADKSFKLLKKNPRHPSLQFKKVGEMWSARLGRAHRALAVEDGTDFIWVWIGSHDNYEKMIKRR